MQEELQAVYSGAKEHFGLRHGQVTKDISPGEGTVEAALFRFTIVVAQDEDDPARVRISRSLVPRDLPPAFETVFPVMDEIVMPLNGDADFAALVHRVEE